MDIVNRPIHRVGKSRLPGDPAVGLGLVLFGVRRVVEVRQDDLIPVLPGEANVLALEAQEVQTARVVQRLQAKPVLLVGFSLENGFNFAVGLVAPGPEAMLFALIGSTTVSFSAITSTYLLRVVILTT